LNRDISVEDLEWVMDKIEKESELFMDEYNRNVGRVTRIIRHYISEKKMSDNMIYTDGNGY